MFTQPHARGANQGAANAPRKCRSACRARSNASAAISLTTVRTTVRPLSRAHGAERHQRVPRRFAARRAAPRRRRHFDFMMFDRKREGIAGGNARGVLPRYQFGELKKSTKAEQPFFAARSTPETPRCAAAASSRCFPASCRAMVHRLCELAWSGTLRPPPLAGPRGLPPPATRVRVTRRASRLAASRIVARERGNGENPPSAVASHPMTTPTLNAQSTARHRVLALLVANSADRRPVARMRALRALDHRRSRRPLRVFLLRNAATLQRSMGSPTTSHEHRVSLRDAVDAG